MKKQYLLSISILLILSSCHKIRSFKKIQIEAIKANQFGKSDKLINEAGKVVNEIDFSVKTPNSEKSKEVTDGVVPFITIENPSAEITRLINPDEIVIPQKSINIIFDYPLKNPATFTFTNPNGFSRKDLIQKISEKYNEIYKDEEATAKTKTIPEKERTGLINRNETDGKYGIWGHDLSDLALSGIEVHQTTDGQINLVLLVES